MNGVMLEITEVITLMTTICLLLSYLHKMCKTLPGLFSSSGFVSTDDKKYHFKYGPNVEEYTAQELQEYYPDIMPRIQKYTRIHNELRKALITRDKWIRTS